MQRAILCSELRRAEKRQSAKGSVRSAPPGEAQHSKAALLLPPPPPPPLALRPLPWLALRLYKVGGLFFADFLARSQQGWGQSGLSFYPRIPAALGKRQRTSWETALKRPAGRGSRKQEWSLQLERQFALEEGRKSCGASDEPPVEGFGKGLLETKVQGALCVVQRGMEPSGPWQSTSKHQLLGRIY